MGLYDFVKALGISSSGEAEAAEKIKSQSKKPTRDQGTGR